MRFLTPLLIAAGLSLAPITVVPVAAPSTSSVAEAVDCTGPHYATDYRYVTENFVDGNPNDPTWRVMHELKFRNCAGKGARRWADPISETIGCREHDGPTGIVGMREVRFNSRIWDRDGHEVNPGVWDLECHSRNWDTETHYFRAINKFHRCRVGGPRIDTSVEVDIAFDTNPTTRLSSAWWGFTGPVRITC